MIERPIRVAWFASLALLAAGAWAFPERARAPQSPASAPAAPAASAATARRVPPPWLKPVDINSASLAELKSLPGIGDAEAARIVKARPYPSKAKLVADQVLSPAQYSALKGRIVAGHPQAPKARPAKPAAGKASAGKS